LKGKRSLWIAIGLLVAAALLLIFALSGCAGQMCFQPMDCYKLPTYSHANCPPPGVDTCTWRSQRGIDRMQPRVILYDDVSPQGRVMNPADVR